MNKLAASTDFKLIKTQRKTIALHIQPDGSLLVKAPITVSDKIINNFVNSRQDWIIKKLNLVNSIRAQSRNNRVVEGSRLPFLGDFYSIELNDTIKEELIFDNKFIFKNADNMNSKMLNWYRTEANNILAGIVDEKARLFNFKVKCVKISSAKKRWGSCNTKGIINLSWRLITLPEHIINYVVVHELAHLKEMNHSKNFWRVVGNLMPEYKLYEKWLRENHFKYQIENL